MRANTHLAAPDAAVAKAAVAAERAHRGEGAVAVGAQPLARRVLLRHALRAVPVALAARGAERLRAAGPARLVVGLVLVAAAPLARPIGHAAGAEARVRKEADAAVVRSLARAALPRAILVGRRIEVERHLGAREAALLRRGDGGNGHGLSERGPPVGVVDDVPFVAVVVTG